MSKNVLITGGNSGIGREMARALAAEGNRVIIASRNTQKSEDALDDIRHGHPAADVEAMTLDLGDFEDIDRFAPELLEKMPVIDVLILNAGLYTQPLRKVKSGFEAMIGIMHFGHFRLVQHILSAVKSAEQGRIIVTSSMVHNVGSINEASFTDPLRHRIAVRGYAQAKLANLLFTRELARRLEGTNVTVNAFHPGAVATGIWAELPGPLQKVINLALISPAKGADTAVWLATGPEGGRSTGQYFVKRSQKTGSRTSQDAGLAERLWEMSEQRM